MSVLRLGAVEYLNARPLVFGLDLDPRVAVRFDIPSSCATLLHEGAIDLGLIPSIEYARARPGAPYWIVPDVAIASRGPVASVALYTTRPIADVRSIALDVSSRTSAALVQVLCARRFMIEPTFDAAGPDLAGMLEGSDAALIIGDHALLLEEPVGVEKVDLGEVWTAMTGLPFVYAFWAGRKAAVAPEHISLLQRARDSGVQQTASIAEAYFTDAGQQAVGVRYLHDNIKYYLGDDECAGLELFYRYAAELGIVPETGTLRFYP